MSKEQNTNTGMGFPALLTLIFITLKLMGYITWSWWWILSPLWISATLIILIAVIYAIVIIKKAK